MTVAHLGAHADADGADVRGVQRASPTASTLCLFDDAGNETRRPLEADDGLRVARTRRRRGARPALRLSRPRPVGPGTGARCNPAKLLLDPYARAIAGERAMAPGGVRRGPATRRRTCRARWCARTQFDWGDDRPPGTPLEDSIIYELHVKGFTKLHPDVPEELRGTYAGLAHPAVDRSPDRARRHGGRAAARPPVRPRRARWSRAGCATTGATSRSATSRPHNEYASGDGGQQVGEFKPMVARAARGRARGDPRRRVQPHRRGRRGRPDAVLPRPRQRRVLPPAGRSEPLRRRHRLRQHVRRAPPTGTAAGHGFAALLGAGDARRRVSLRPRGEPRPRRRATSIRSARSWRPSARTPCSRR